MAKVPQSLHQFPLLPTEIRLKIWRLTVTSRIVTITSKPVNLDVNNLSFESFDPRHCPPICAKHSRPQREPVPVLLHVCHESRAEGLKIYSHFSSELFDGGLASISRDTLYHARCHHKTVAGEVIFGNPSGPFENWNPNRSVFARLAANPADVTEIISLAVCCCQMRAVPDAPNFNDVVETLQKYKKLNELMFVRRGTEEFVNELKSSQDELGPADDETWIRVGPADSSRMRSMRNRSTRGKMWVHMVHAWNFKERLEEVMLNGDDEWKMPRIRCVVIVGGEVAWEQEFGQNVRDKAELLR